MTLQYQKLHTLHEMQMCAASHVIEEKQLAERDFKDTRQNVGGMTGGFHLITNPLKSQFLPYS